MTVRICRVAIPEGDSAYNTLAPGPHFRIDIPGKPAVAIVVGEENARIVAAAWDLTAAAEKMLTPSRRAGMSRVVGSYTWAVTNEQFTALRDALDSTKKPEEPVEFLVSLVAPGVGSRSEARRLIAGGQITVDGDPVTDVMAEVSVNATIEWERPNAPMKHLHGRKR